MTAAEGKQSAQSVARSSGAATEDRELLRVYLGLAPKERESAFWCTAEAARHTGLTQRTIQGWIRSGKVRALRIGKKYFALRSSLEEFLLELGRDD